MRSIGTLVLIIAAILALLEEIAPRHSLLEAVEDVEKAVPMGLSLPVALAIIGAILIVVVVVIIITHQSSYELG